MAKAADDVILRDRMQFDFAAGGNRTTLYGRIDMSNYVNPITRQGLAVKEVFFQLRNADGTSLPNTGAFLPVADYSSGSTTGGADSALKIYATTRAYENASEVGIASPDVLCVEEHISVVGPSHDGAFPNNNGAPLVVQSTRYGPMDLHPNGFTIVSDLLIGVAADGWVNLDDNTLEIDILLIAEPIKVTEGRMNEILSQAQDL